MKFLNILTAIILIVGGLNWGSIGLFNVNLVETIFGQMPTLIKSIYIAVGLSAIFQLFACSALRSCCKSNHEQ